MKLYLAQLKNKNLMLHFQEVKEFINSIFTSIISVFEDDQDISTMNQS